MTARGSTQIPTTRAAVARTLVSMIADPGARRICPGGGQTIVRVGGAGRIRLQRGLPGLHRLDVGQKSLGGRAFLRKPERARLLAQPARELSKTDLPGSGAVQEKMDPRPRLRDSRAASSGGCPTVIRAGRGPEPAARKISGNRFDALAQRPGWSGRLEVFGEPLVEPERQVAERRRGAGRGSPRVAGLPRAAGST